MPKYIYNGYEVELVPGQCFSSHVNFYDPTDPMKRRIKSGVPGTSLFVVEDVIPDNVISLADQRKKKEEQSQLLEEELVEDENGDFVPVVRKTEEPSVTVIGDDDVIKVDINSLSLETARKTEIAGLTPTTIKTIVSNRPVYGYQSFEELVAINKGKTRQSVQWDVLSTVFRFDGAVPD